MAEETQTTQTTTELGGAQTAGGDPNTSTPDSVQAEKTFTQAEVNELIRGRSEWLQKKPLGNTAQLPAIAFAARLLAYFPPYCTNFV